MLEKSIKRIVLTLCLLLTVCFSAHSQDTSKTTTTNDSLRTVTITVDQLRTTNLIFAEHKELTSLVPLLHQENDNLQLINKSWERSDSLKTVQLHRQNQIMSQQAQDIERLNKSFKISTSVAGTAVGMTIIVTVLCLILK